MRKSNNLREKFWTMLLGTLAALGSIGSAIYGAARSARYNKAAQADLTDNYMNTQRVLNSELRKDYTSRTDFQNILNRQRELLDEYTKRERGVNAVIGGNDNAVFAQKKANAASVANTMSNIAGRAATYKEGVQNRILANDANYTQQMANLKLQQGQTVANAAGQVSKAMSGLASADNATWGDDLNMFGLDMSNYELRDDGHYYKIPKNQR